MNSIYQRICIRSPKVNRAFFYLPRCADIVNLPLGCTQVKVDGDCCPKIQCSGTTGSFVGSQTVGGTIGGSAVPQPQPGMTVTGSPGGTITGKLSKSVLRSLHW